MEGFQEEINLGEESPTRSDQNNAGRTFHMR